MAYASLPSPNFPLAGDKSERRRIRKGTQSCWECKQRKVRCTFAAPQHVNANVNVNVTCDGCKRRGTLCVSQEFPHVPKGISTSTSSTRQLGDRLGRVEALVEQLVKNADISGMLDDPKDFPPRQRRDVQRQLRTLDSNSPNLNGELGHEAVVCVTPTILSPCTSNDAKRRLDPENPVRTKSPSPPTVTAALRSTQPVGQYEQLRCALLAVWPSEHDLDIILGIPVKITGCLHGLICTPASTAQGEKVPSPQEMLQLPPPGCCPILVARKLLILASYLQAFPPSGIQSLCHLGISYHDIMSRAVNTVHSLVNCNDDLVTSIEGIECITIESMYHNNAGNLRRAWVTMRRAMLIAQMMNLHRGGSLPSIKILERRTCINPEYIWFRLVQADRYLSLMLGLPQGAPENDFFATAKALEVCTPMERLQRIDCVVAGRILQRNEADINDLAAMQDIDNLLQEASMTMPPQWWLLPNLESTADHQTEHFHETMRIMDQLTHYHLVVRLHLPYVLRSLVDRKYEYSKITAVNASREVLARFVAFRISNPIGSYCRGIDFLVFIASTTLCLAHIDSHRHGKAFASDGEDGFCFSSLAHQRPSDRGMMECALESIQYMANASGDMIASKIATIFRHLLVIEVDAAGGSSYNTSSVSGEEGLECSGESSDGGNVLHINIPSVGTVKVERGGVSRSVMTMPSQGASTTSVSQAPSTNPRVSFSTSPLPETQDEHTRQLLSMLDCPTRYSIGDQSVNPEWQAVPLHSGPLVPPQHSGSAGKYRSISSFHSDDVQAVQPLILGLEGGVEDWALQGVDTAFFDSLIRGSDLDAAERSYWTQ
jgi:Fungal Zn(2)-Cys(6) binuclear cluster domain